MNSINYQDNDTLQALVSDEFGQWSPSLHIDQDQINRFADLTGDHMWMHVDEERCARESPFGTTIAHGFLILSLLPKFKSAPPAISQISGFSHMMNYGSNKLRFLGAAPVDSELHARSRVKSVAVNDNKTQITLETHVHIKGEERPVLIYELMFVYL